MRQPFKWPLQSQSDGGISRAYCGHMSTDHRKLEAFTLADEFAIRAYTATRDFPKEERYGIRSQIRRAAVAVPTNIVEGCARDSDRSTPGKSKWRWALPAKRSI